MRIKLKTACVDFKYKRFSYTKLKEYTKPYNELQEKLSKSDKYDFDKNGVFIDIGEYGSDKFYYFLEQSKNLSGHRFMYNVVFDNVENEDIEAFIFAGCAGSDAFSINYECSNTIEEYNFHDTDAKYPLNIQKKFKFKKFKAKDCGVYPIGKDNIITTYINKLFKKNKITGYSTINIHKCRGKETYSDVCVISSSNFIGPCDKNILTYEEENEFTNTKTLGCIGHLIYPKSSLKDMLDVNYTQEAFDIDAKPYMVVSKKVEKLCRENNIDVCLKPTITKNSEIYNRYVELMCNLAKDLLRFNPKHRISQGGHELDPQEILDKLDMSPNCV